MLNKKNKCHHEGKHSYNHSNSNITKETRQESFVVRPATRQVDILKVLGDREMTSREIAYELGFMDLNAVKPRLTELKDIGLVEPVGKKKDFVTDRTVAVWKAVPRNAQ